ncbi:MAG: hypothetical protein ACKVS6_07180 [Planctomycetota bacterium]
MPILIALLAGISDFASEMLVLRAGRFGLGASAQASTLLLALALAGFGVGAALARKFSGARQFAILRLAGAGVSAAAILLPMELAAADGILASAFAPAISIASAFFFAIPAGASIPLLYPWTRGSASRAGFLTSANALGSILGVWIGGVVGPTQLGSFACVLIIVGLQLFTAAVSLVTAGSYSSEDPDSAARNRKLREHAIHPHIRHTRPAAAIALAASAGAATIALEGLIGRLLPFFFIENSESTALLLIGALFGISLGAGGAGILLKRVSPISVAGWAISVLVFSGMFILVTLEILTRQLWLFNPLDAGEYWLYRGIVAAVLIVPPLMAAGALSPAAFALAAGPGRDRASKLNLAYAAGAIAPAFIIPFLLTIGVTSSAQIGAVGVLVFPAGFILFGLRALPLLLPIVAGTCLGASALTTRVPPFRSKPWLEVYETREGPIGVAAAVLDRRLHEKTLFTNAFRAAATGDDYRYTRSLTHLPMLLAADEPKRAAIIAVGTGSTAGAAARYKSLSRIELVEISGDVFELLHWFSPSSDALFIDNKSGVDAAATRPAIGHERPLLDPRLKIVMEDGRRFVARNGKPFEILVLEPLPPNVPAAYPLYTHEFYKLSKRRLTKGGVLAQWIPIHETTEPRAFRALVATFAHAFVHRALFMIGNSAILLGSDEPLKLNSARLQAALSDPYLSADLQRTGCASAGDIAAQCALGSRGLDAFPTDAILYDDVATIERRGFVSLAITRRYEKENLETILRAREGAADELLPSMEALSEGEQAARRAAGTAYLKSRRVIADFDSGGIVEPNSSIFTEATAHPFAALDAERFVALRAYTFGMGKLANNEVLKALPELEQAAWGLRHPNGILGYAIGLLRSGQKENAQLYATIAFGLDPTLGDPPEHYNTGQERWIEDAKTLRAPANELLQQLPSLSNNLVDLANALISTDAARNAAAKIFTIRQRDALAFKIELLASRALSATPDEIGAAKIVAGYLYDPTLASAMLKIDAAKK